MKKVVKSLVVLTSVLAMGACSPDKKEAATSSSTESNREKQKLHQGHRNNPIQTQQK